MTVFRGRPDLLQRFREGERTALEIVYRAYAAKVAAIVRYGLRAPSRHGQVRSFSRPEDLGDLVQETFMQAFAPAARAGFDGLRDYGPYLFGVARNVMIGWARRAGREVPTDWPEMEALANAKASNGDDDGAGADLKVRSVVERYLEGLEPELRAVHEVRFLRELSQEQGAAALGISRQSLRTLEQRLRTGLRRALKQNELGASRPR
jgi:RNA polymerase sigma factor (sigma-70 family)